MTASRPQSGRRAVTNRTHSDSVTPLHRKRAYYNVTIINHETEFAMHNATSLSPNSRNAVAECAVPCNMPYELDTFISLKIIVELLGTLCTPNTIIVNVCTPSRASPEQSSALASSLWSLADSQSSRAPAKIEEKCIYYYIY